MLKSGQQGGDLKEKLMRLTKRQLKRIIREEYSRLKRQGLIKESGNDRFEEEGMDWDMVNRIKMYIDDLLEEQPEYEEDYDGLMDHLMDVWGAEADEEEIYEAVSSF